MKRPIPEAALNQHIAVLGKTRSGKSSVMRGLAEGLLERKMPVCIIDPKGDWWGIKLAADGKHSGYPVVVFGGEHADVPIDARVGAQVAELYATGNRSCLIDLGGWMVGDRTRFWIDFASALFKHTRGLRWLIVDEVHNFAPKGKIMDPDAGKALHWANRLASEGLGKGLHMIFASQRPQKVHNDTLTSAETLIAMRVLHPSDRGAVADWIKGCGDLELGNKVLNSLAQMDRGEGWAWSPEIGFGPERIKFPMFKTYDSFKPQTADDVKSLKGWAAVDLDEVRSKFAAYVEKAKADNPKLLRAELAKLKAELAKKPAAVPSLLPDAKALQAEHERGYKAGVSWAFDTVAARTKDAGHRLVHLAGELDALKRALEEPFQKVGVIKRGDSVVVHGMNGQKKPTLMKVVATAHASDLPRAQQKILDTLAMLQEIGVPQPSKAQLALWCEVSPTSGGYFNNLGALRSAGLIEYPSGGTVVLTAAGKSAANEMPVPSQEEMQAAIIAKVGPAKGAILKAVIDIYPDAIAKDDLAQRIGVSPTSGGYFNNLGSLRTLGVIDYPQRGTVAAEPILFLS